MGFSWLSLFAWGPYKPFFHLIRSLLRGFHWQNDSTSDLLKPVFSARKVFLHFQIVVAAQSDYSQVKNDGLAPLRYTKNSKE